MKSAALRAPATGRMKCLLCYLAAFGLPLAFLWFSAAVLYPRWLAGTARDCFAIGSSAFPFLPLEWFLTPTAGKSGEVLTALLEENRLRLLAGCGLTAWNLTLLCQLCWRSFSAADACFARAARHAAVGGLFMLLAVTAVCAGMIWFLIQCGAAAADHWREAVCCFGIYPLLPPAAAIPFRLAAPACLSGRHAFFKRL